MRRPEAGQAGMHGHVALALLLSLITSRSVVGQPGVLPLRPVKTKGSGVVEIWTPRA